MQRDTVGPETTGHVVQRDLIRVAGTLVALVGAFSSPAVASASGTAATGFIQAVAGSALVDGETFTISDGVNPTVFEFDSNASVTAGHEQVPFTGTKTATQMGGTITSVVGSASPLNVFSQNAGNGG